MTRPALTAREQNRRKREREWLEAKVAAARSLTDADRVRILRELELAEEARRASKDPEQLAREEQVRKYLDRQGKDRYRALAERWSKASSEGGSDTP